MVRELGVRVNVLIDGEEVLILVLRESGRGGECAREQESGTGFKRELT